VRSLVIVIIGFALGLLLAIGGGVLQ